MVHAFSPLQRASHWSAVALAPRGLRVMAVQHVVDHYRKNEQQVGSTMLPFVRRLPKGRQSGV
jgi:hypothetical protein